jgi:choice-of-anchor A domain-containing protein
MNAARILAISAVLFAATVGSASAVVLTASDIMGQFNAVVTGKFSSGHDVEGRMVAGELVTGATFYNGPRGLASNFAAINALKIDNFNANINNGGSVNYQLSNGASFNLNGGGKVVQQSASFAMSDLSTPLIALMGQLGALASNSVIDARDSNNFTFKLTPDAAGLAVFNLSTGLLGSASNIIFSGSADTIIVNVTGGNFTEIGNFNDNGNLKSHIIWNFIDATSLSFKGWHGAVLAGNGDVINSSAMEGLLYAKSFVGGGELHDYRFEGTLPVAATAARAVPEPATWAICAIGLLALGASRRRRPTARLA